MTVRSKGHNMKTYYLHNLQEHFFQTLSTSIESSISVETIFPIQCLCHGLTFRRQQDNILCSVLPLTQLQRKSFQYGIIWRVSDEESFSVCLKNVPTVSSYSEVLLYQQTIHLHLFALYSKVAKTHCLHNLQEHFPDSFNFYRVSFMD